MNGVVLMNFKKIVTFIFLIYAFTALFSNNVQADTIKIKYNNKTMNYSDTQVVYTFNGNIIKSKYPGIIVDGISLASAKEIFSDSKIGLKYKYDKKSNTVEFSQSGKKLVLTLDSNTAKLNGVTTYVPIAPRIIEFPDKAKKVFVPARFVATAFGFTYNWNASTGIATLTGKESSNSKSTAAKSNTLLYGTKKYTIKGDKVIFRVGSTKLNTGNLPGVYLGSILMAPAKEIFLSESVEGGFLQNKSKNTITVSFEDDSLLMTLGSKTAYLNGSKVKLSKAPDSVTINSSNKSSVYIPIYDVCDLFHIDVFTNGKDAELMLPDDIDVEELTEHEDINDDENTKTDDNSKPAVPDNSGSSNVGSMPFTWKSMGLLPNIASLGTIQQLSGSSSSGVVNSSIIDIKNVISTGAVSFDTYEITSTSGFNSVLGNLSGNTLAVELSNISSDFTRNYLIATSYVNSISSTYDGSKSTVYFNLADGVVGYDMSISQDNKILTVRIYRNTITEISGNYNGQTYNFNIVSTHPINLQASPGGSTEDIVFTIANVSSEVPNNMYMGRTEDNVSLFNYQNLGNGSIVINVKKISEYAYYIKQSGNITTLIFSKQSTGKNAAIISLPSGVDISQISDEDNYFSNNFTVTLPGDLRAHFAANPVKYDAMRVSNVTASLNDYGDTVLSFDTTDLYAYKLNITQTKVSIDIDIAKKLYSKVVVIDPGHGAHDSGALSPDKIYREKDLVLAIGYTYFKNYLDDEDLKVYWTRKGDTFMTLNDRAGFASKVSADIFISLHMNSAPNKSAKGTEIYYSTRNNYIQYNGLSSYTLADILLRNITYTFSTQNRGVKSNVFVVTNTNTVPAVLVEFGFLSNTSDLNKFKKLENQDRAAEVLYDSIQEIFEQYPTGR